MQILPKHQRHFYWQRLLLLSGVICCFGLGAIEVANAQETTVAKKPISESIIAQAERSQPNRSRLRTPFFEEERKLTFGFGDFLQTALDGADNFFAADAINNLSNFSNQVLSSPTIQNIPGTITIVNRNKNNANFLTTTFVSDVPGLANLTFRSPIYGSDPRIGSITSTDNLGNLISNGVRNYNGSFSVNGDRVSGAVLVFDPSHPGTTILIELSPTTIPNASNSDTPISAPATLSIGLPTDR